MTRSVRVTASSLKLRSLPIVDANTDTGRRLSAGQVATSFGETFDKQWQFLNAQGGSGWVSAQYLQPATTQPPSPTTAAPAKRHLYTLEGEDPQLTAAIEKLRVKALAEGIEFTTADFGGVRTQADTIRIMKYRDDDYAVYVRNLKRTNPGKAPTPKNTWRKIAPFGSSFHNYGAARDLRVTKYPPSFTASKALDRLRALAPSCGLKIITNDPPHMQLPITLAQARARWLARQ